jgi:hypothetical protein
VPTQCVPPVICYLPWMLGEHCRKVVEAGKTGDSEPCRLNGGQPVGEVQQPEPLTCRSLRPKIE